ncbi:MAG: ATP-binding protein [Burkholderiaceae bacterium]|nr:ATP-binding protein [Burkholderiaceae bacterium]
MTTLLPRLSFRQLLLLAFLLIAALLSAASLRSLFALEQLLGQSGEGARRAVAEAATAQLLHERSLAMERAARQYQVLGDALLRQRFEAAARDAAQALDRLEAAGLPPAPIAAWRDGLATLRGQLGGPGAMGADLGPVFRRLDALDAELAEAVRRAAEARNERLAAELDAGRIDLGRQVLAASAVALALAFAFGLWLARPLERLEAAVLALGENRLDQPIEIQGPRDVRALGRRLEWLRQRLAELDADQARFLRHVSHELKTPLAALREGVALLQEQVAGPLSEGQRQVARILQDNTAVLQRQIEDLLRYNAAAFAARRLERRPTELAGLLAALVEQQRLQWQARQLRVEILGGPLHAEVDAAQLGVALGNLLSNAIRFSPVGGGIRWQLAPRAGRACLELSDEGPGVAPADRARIFEPFYRGERQNPDAPRGSGIGLSIVQEIVAAHGGRVELLPASGDAPADPGAAPVTAAQAAGARFRIELPHALPNPT